MPGISLCLCLCAFFSWGKKQSGSMLSECLNVCSSYDLLQPIPGGSTYILLPLCVVGGEEVPSGERAPDALFFWNFASFLSSLPDRFTDRVESYCHLLLFTSAESSLKCRGDLDELLSLTLSSDDHIPASESKLAYWKV